MSMNDAASFFGKKLKPKKDDKPAPAGESYTEINNQDNGEARPNIEAESATEENVDRAEIDAELEQEIIEDIKSDTGSETNISDNGKTINNGEDDENSEDNSPRFQVFISGQLLLGISDAIFPAIIIKGSKFVGYKHKKTRSELMLTDNEREMLEPIADQAAIEIFNQMSPLQQFFVALGAMYGSKL